MPWWAWAQRFEREFDAAYRALGVAAPTYEPRATGHIPEMIDLVQRLLDAGHAYIGESGNVYYDVRSLPGYGSLTNQRLEDLATTEDESQIDDDVEADKRDPRDFALWKAPKPGEPATASWDSPWGRGRPGWHLECSAMAGRYLGDVFDVHGGGIDLRFPHHENEQAQSHAAGRGFARYWMHNAWVTIEGEKMSKSLGNSLTVRAVAREVPPVVLRLALGTVHYRSTVAYSPATLAEAAAVWERLSGFATRSADMVGEVPLEDVAHLPVEELPPGFVSAMDDDVNVSGALAVVHEAVTRGNTALASRDADAARRSQLEVRSMLDVLGLDPLCEQWRAPGGSTAEHAALTSLVEGMLERRSQARAAKDWATADAVRDALAGAGIAVEDSPQGVRWHVEGR